MSADTRNCMYRLTPGGHPGWRIVGADMGVARVANDELDTWAWWPTSQLIAVEPSTGLAAAAGRVEASLAPVTLPAATIAPVVAADRKDAGGVIASPPATGAPIKGARNTDPDTAHEAALAQSDARNRQVYDCILALIFEHGPLTDWQLAEKLTGRMGERIIATSAGKRRGELRDMGLVADTGHRGPTETGPKKGIRWGLTADGAAQVAA